MLSFAYTHVDELRVRNAAQARSPRSLKITLIVDKMDSAKNHVPWFSNGRKPKDIDTLLKGVLKLHVTGVIIHGNPDKRFIFWSLPWMPGNANLNVECIRRALVHYLSGLAFRPKLYFQFDNASDNKNFTMLCLAAWLVHNSYVSQVNHQSSIGCSGPSRIHTPSQSVIASRVSS